MTLSFIVHRSAFSEVITVEHKWRLGYNDCDPRLIKAQ